jgi:sirohydrochlorin cobaltochelatase
VRLAYLEQMKPSLPQTLDALARERVTAVRIVPLFFGHGGHVKGDLPMLIETAHQKFPHIAISLDAPIGEQSAVIEAIANAIIRQAANK